MADLSKVSWEDVPEIFLEQAVEEYNIRKKHSIELIDEGYSSDQIRNFWIACPDYMIRKRHAYSIALKMLQGTKALV